MKRTYHEAELRKRIEHLYYMGYTVIEAWEVKEWWQRERITKMVYAEILRTWRDVAGDTSKISVNLKSGVVISEFIRIASINAN